MTNRWSASQAQKLLEATNNVDNAFPIVSDFSKSYFVIFTLLKDQSKGILGCPHYQRASKIEANCCGRWFCCRFCHDEVSDHAIDRKLTERMMCMHCLVPQPASKRCNNVKCGREISNFYCDICKFWDNDVTKSIFHCDECGLCRVGKGLGTDFFHCKTCNICMSIALKGRHKCIERNLESDCPICGEYMFTSTQTIIFMVRLI